MAKVLEELLPEAEHQKIQTKTLCLGAAKLLTDAARPCKCSALNRHTYLWHTERSGQENLEDVIWKLVMDLGDARSVVVSATHSIFRFIESCGHNVCKDQLLRLVAVSICLNAKFWDDVEACRRTNRDIARKSSIPLDEVGTMELAFLGSLDWNLCLTKEHFLECEAKIEAGAEAWYSEQDAKRESYSPLSSTDVAEELGERLGQL